MYLLILIIIVIILVISILYNSIEYFTVFNNEAVQNISSLYNNKKLFADQIQIGDEAYRTNIDNKGNISVSYNNNKKYTLNEFGNIVYPDIQQWKTITGKSFPNGMNSGGITTTNGTKSCEALCDGDPFCIGYTYNNNNSECTTKYLIKTDSINDSLAGVPQFKDGIRNGFKRFYNKKFVNDNDQNTVNKTANLDDCEKNCYDDPKCAGYTFKQGRNCGLHYFVENNNIISGVKTI